ncbi:hypothetical protein CKF54_00850 [Psittacicella hinzii]|uniref:Uncharacterized protein n=1 Tax=Psittacicella hinzii TaxID=2028575 RepID=A0A3A1Y9V3_9GAMM|nr:hypothetical protein [Psittacicella hinzii]RIY34321.1 hypothetical protein CKF54_00850 [Psittacicella hinzii]
MVRAPLVFLFDIYLRFAKTTLNEDFEHFYMWLTNYDAGNGVLNYNGTPYKPFNVKFSNLQEEIASNSKNKVQLSNLNQRFASLFALHDNFIGGSVKVTIIYKDNLIIKSPEWSKEFQISAFSSYDVDKLVLEIVTYLDQERTLPPIDCRELCPNDLGDRDCAYVGEETECNKTFKRCKELNNTDRFRGVEVGTE